MRQCARSVLALGLRWMSTPARPAAAAWPHDPNHGNVAPCRATGDPYSPVSIPDGAGGAIVAWYDARGGDCDIYAQRISAAGAPLWTADGVPRRRR